MDMFEKIASAKWVSATFETCYLVNINIIVVSALHSSG